LNSTEVVAVVDGPGMALVFVHAIPLAEGEAEGHESAVVEGYKD
jgi:hypothetical protein